MDLAGNESEDSVELTQENISAALDSLSSMYLPDLAASNSNGAVPDKPQINDAFLKIVEQPQSRGFRFRYKCEGPSHGGIQGVKSEKSRKSYPSVQIMNYNGPARIIVSLVTDDPVPKSHAHELVGKSCENGICRIDQDHRNPVFSFPNIGVMHVTKRKVADVLKERISDSMLLNKRISSGNVNDTTIILNDTERKKAKEQADSQAKNMHLNVVRLCFQAYLQDKNGNLSIVLPSVVSNHIYDSKSPGASALKICRMDKCGGYCTGNEEIFLLCEKVQKDDIKVWFIELDDDQSVVWKKEANFGPTDVHKQYAIVFRTPEYRNIHITDPVKVYIKLVRQSDDECSEPKAFTYYPQNLDEDDIDRKRRKVLPRIPDSDSLFQTLNNPTNPDFTQFSEISAPLFQFSNGGSTNMNYTNHDLFQFGDLTEAALFGATAMPRPMDIKLSTDVTDIDFNDLEVDSRPCDSISLKPYKPLVYCKDMRTPLIEVEEKKDLKDIKLSKMEDNKPIKLEKEMKKDNKPIKLEKEIKKDKPIKLEKEIKKDEKPIKLEKEMKKEFGSCKEIKKLPTEGETKGIKQEDKPASINKTPLDEDLLMSFRLFCSTGNLQCLFIKNRNLMLIPNKDGDNCLHLALINNQSDVVQNLLPVIATQTEDLNVPNHRFQSCLHLAVLTNQPDMVELLLKQGMKRTLVDCNGNTAVHLAVKYNYIECLRSLLKPDFSRHSQTDPFPELDNLNCEGYSPIHLACLKGSMESVLLLIEAKAEVNLPDGKSGRTPLHMAVEKNDLLLAGELLLEAECETDCMTYDGNTPLHLACGREYDAMVALLLSVGADPEAATGMTEWCLSDNDSDFESSTDEDHWLDEIKGTRPRDLVYDNDKILRLLNGEPYESSIPSSDSGVTDLFGGDFSQLSDQMRQNLANLIESADGINNWKSLAKLLKVEYLIDEVKSTRGPALSILDMYEMLGGKLEDLYSAFQKLEMNDAVRLLNQVIR